MYLKTKLDWRGYQLALQNEETMGCSPEQTALCVAISEFRDMTHEMQEVLREIIYGNGSAAHAVARKLLEDYTPPSPHDTSPVSASAEDK